MMDNQLRQEQTLRQTYNLTPQQLAYFRLLEMNDVQLEQEVHRQLEENPALGVDNSEAPENTFTETATDLQRADYRDDDMPSYLANSKSSMIESTSSVAEKTLQEHLKEQYALTPLAAEQPDLTPLADFIIDSIDPNGYLHRSPAALADDMAIICGILYPTVDVEHVISAIRQLDPAGVAASSLQESLLLQAQRLENEPDMRDIVLKILTDGFDDLAGHRYDSLASKTRCDKATLRSALDFIRRLNPKPGASFASSGSAISGNADDTITPDFEIEVNDGVVSVSMPSRIPSLVVESSFAPDDSSTKRRDATNTWIRRQREEADNFIYAISQRRKTMLDIMKAIINRQKAFFTGDEAGQTSALRPMVLKDLSNATGYDISTISRALQGKYAETPWGIFPLRYFFNEAVAAGNEDDGVAQSAAMEALRSVIEGENPQKPLSDLAITKILNEQGLNVARRTVAKYRDRMGIPPARERRQI